ncbi:AAA domain-containing protein [Deinococcus reticulitermitis]|uniref:AAA domain-containing protein n=1 Tax=Deinococcus reticulitermitis TaxID=856736 RepID=A0A1H7CJE0_9DEIO|nr:AAA family ATPase [Deinococcus reticulitermitis]SEJ85805.1 AAA domain-containing protein [Deinococcus reticulitermitis]
MLIWVNGPFGVGKTQTAYELHRRLPPSFVCDPEQLGFGIQRMTPPELRGDFQDVPLWREGVYQLLDHTLTHADRVVIVPMTLVVPAYFAEIVGRLRENGHTVHHVALLASRDTLRRRQRSRGEGTGSWGAGQIDRCLAGLSQLPVADHLPTDGLGLEEVVEQIARRTGLDLLPDHAHPLTRPLRRWAVQLRNLRRD